MDIKVPRNGNGLAVGLEKDLNFSLRKVASIDVAFDLVLAEVASQTAHNFEAPAGVTRDCNEQ